MLVGLGFIICFAVILENRGKQDRVGPQMPHEILAQSTPQAEAVIPSAAEQRARDYGHRRSSAFNTQPDTPAPRPVRRQPTERSTTTPQPQRPRPGSETGRDSPTPAHDPASAPAREVAGARQQQSPARQVAQTTPTSEPLSLTATPSQNQPPPAPGRQHRIQKGDTLTTIAARYYGSRSKNVIDAIYQANRTALSSPDALRLDQVIVLPEIAGLATPSPAAPPESAVKPNAPTEKPAEQNPQPQYRSYQVRKGDRYVTIAKEQLGSEGRWKEIAELNKDIFPDPARIQHGVRIRLPVVARGDAEGSDS